MTSNAFALLAVMSLLSACLLETHSGYSATVRNDLDTSVVLYLDVPNLPPSSAVAHGVSIGPGGTFADHWLVPAGPDDARRAVVRLLDSTGALVFCHAYSWSELENSGFTIRVSTRRNDC